MLAVPAELTLGCSCSKFGTGMSGRRERNSSESVNALQSENQDLRRQLALAEARLMELDERLKQSITCRRAIRLYICLIDIFRCGLQICGPCQEVIIHNAVLQIT